MTLSDRIELWLEEQITSGKTREEIHNTHFSDGKTIGVIKKSGKSNYKLEFYIDTKAVFFQ
ncbi:hypothetical protein CHH83_01935 [Bacillus sp. 7586-K]|nr:hypothetical protein CHH83_01935 [Bacillus sp. 7586-K]